MKVVTLCFTFFWENKYNFDDFEVDLPSLFLNKMISTPTNNLVLLALVLRRKSPKNNALKLLSDQHMYFWYRILLLLYLCEPAEQADIKVTTKLVFSCLKNCNHQQASCLAFRLIQKQEKQYMSIAIGQLTIIIFT